MGGLGNEMPWWKQVLYHVIGFIIDFKHRQWYWKGLKRALRRRK